MTVGALTSLQKKQSAYETKISAMGKLQSALSSLQTSAKSMKPGVLESATTKFAAYTASVTDTAVATATVTKAPSPAVTRSKSRNWRKRSACRVPHSAAVPPALQARADH